MTTHTIWLGSLRGILFRLELQGKFRRKSAWFPLFGRRPVFHNLLTLSAGVRYDAEFFCTSILPDLEKNICEGTRIKTLRGIYLHLGNAPAHDAKRSRQEIARTKTMKVVHPAYSLDIASSDFFLFGHLTREMVGFTTSSPEDILSAIRRIFVEILKETVAAGSNKWIARFRWIIEHKGEDYQTD
jgi:hypothetical protein